MKEAYVIFIRYNILCLSFSMYADILSKFFFSYFSIIFSFDCRLSFLFVKIKYKVTFQYYLIRTTLIILAPFMCTTECIESCRIINDLKTLNMQIIC